MRVSGVTYSCGVEAGVDVSLDRLCRERGVAHGAAHGRRGVHGGECGRETKRGARGTRGATLTQNGTTGEADATFIHRILR